jgi:hypothetical protein
MNTRRSARCATVGLVLSIGLVAASCVVPSPGGGFAPANWSFKGNSVKVLDSQDEVCIIFCVNQRDEPYLLQIAWRVKINQPNSAQAWVVGHRDNAYDDVGVGETHALSGSEQAKVTFTGVKPLDVVDLFNTNNKLEVFGTYTWAMEQDTVGIQSAAEEVADLFEDALDATLATATLPTEESAIVDLVLDLLFDNIGGAIIILLSNIPLFGLGDDLLGGAFYVGLGAAGTLGAGINAVLSGVSIPSMDLLGDNMIPPKIVGGGMYTMTYQKDFSQNFSGADGTHQYSFTSGPA